MISNTAKSPCPPNHHTGLATDEMAMAISTNPAIASPPVLAHDALADARGLALFRDEQPRRAARR